MSVAVDAVLRRQHKQRNNRLRRSRRNHNVSFAVSNSRNGKCRRRAVSSVRAVRRKYRLNARLGQCDSNSRKANALQHRLDRRNSNNDA